MSIGNSCGDPGAGPLPGSSFSFDPETADQRSPLTPVPTSWREEANSRLHILPEEKMSEKTRGMSKGVFD